MLSKGQAHPFVGPPHRFRVGRHVEAEGAAVGVAEVGAQGDDAFGVAGGFVLGVEALEVGGAEAGGESAVLLVVGVDEKTQGLHGRLLGGDYGM